MINLKEARDKKQTIYNQIFKAVKRTMMEPDFGFPEDEVEDYFRVEVSDRSIPSGEEGECREYIRVEVRAEVSYEGMEEIADELNLIVAKYDKYAYFDFDEPGIMSAYITK